MINNIERLHSFDKGCEEILVINEDDMIRWRYWDGDKNDNDMMQMNNYDDDDEILMMINDNDDEDIRMKKQ